MDFLHRSANNQPQTARSNGAGQATANVSGVDRVRQMVDTEQPRWLRVTFVVLLFSLTVLMIAIAVLFYTGRTHEGQLVDKNKQQAVFLTNGQVYFGQVNDINSQFVDLQDIYYLNSQSQPDSKESTSNPTSFSLVKLGCELHGPQDRMVINRDQVSFWENLSSDGKVSKAIAQWRTQNPNGQKCDDSSTSNSTQQSPTNTDTKDTGDTTN